MENKRICTICKVIKPYSDFHWDKRFNIPFSRCKPCFNERCRKYRASAQGKETHKQWYYSERGTEVRKNRYKNWTKNHPDRVKAVWTLSNAIRDKKISKLPCQICGEIKVEAHHHSYKPEDRLNVTWLCKKHHMEATYHIKY